MTTILVALALALVCAKLAGELCERLGQPAVLGELLVGMAAGNLHLLGGPDLSVLSFSETLTVMGELGAILLLFRVGLESTPTEMMSVGRSAGLVASLGSGVSLILGFGVGEWLRPGESHIQHLFLGGLLSATSVGISARVLKDAGVVRRSFARIILGAAVVDDVLGLMVLAVLSEVIRSVAGSSPVSVGMIARIIVKALLFLVGALLVGSLVSPRLFRGALGLRSRGVVLPLALGFCLALSALAASAGLAPIVGAFAAGLVLEEIHFEGHVLRGEPPLHESLEPLTSLLVPIFFIRMGMLVDLRAFASWDVLGLAAALTAAAALGKLACVLGVPRASGRFAVGIGMLPRGEVVLIFAGIGGALTMHGRAVVDASMYAALLFVIIATTILTPPLLTWWLAWERLQEGNP